MRVTVAKHMAGVLTRRIATPALRLSPMDLHSPVRITIVIRSIQRRWLSGRDPRPMRCVGKTRNRTCDDALVRANNGMSAM